MLDTKFALAYTHIGAGKAPAIEGPFLFADKVTAENFLLTKLIDLIAEYYATQVMATSSTDLISDVQDCFFRNDLDYNDKLLTKAIFEQNPDLFDVEALDQMLRQFATPHGHIFTFSLKRVPTSTLIEQLENADHIQINGDFTKRFSIASNDELSAEPSNFYLDVQSVDEEVKLHSFLFTKTEVENAQYNEEKNVWQIGTTTIVPYKLQQA